MVSSDSFLEAWIAGPYGTNFYTRTFKAASPSAALVFMHGAAEHCGRYTEFHRRFSSQHNITVFTFDLRGFGQTALHPTQRSATSAYGKTDWESQLNDVEWALKYTRTEFPELPVFLMGAGMGGGIILGLLCDLERRNNPFVLGLSGVIASAPCITPTTPPSCAVVWLASVIARLAPYTLYPGRNKPEQLSRNTETNAAYAVDPFVMSPGSVRSILDTLTAGQRVLDESYVHWPEITPVLFLHGEEDPINSFKSTFHLYSKINARDKKLIAYPATTLSFQGAYSELQNEPDGVKEKYVMDVVEFVHGRAVHVDGSRRRRGCN
ncbi:Alpha/Beta hydrolase protein [Mycena alexandri]|uniref:Alpha/Beta hydrolase protein n=1 Tax=Mycena alexandri TaxID=1745969 RepID=A0AAD6WSY9_9AGAR|nr:Alpha/Beta hydrolase protein [Mycena alexandri]